MRVKTMNLMIVILCLTSLVCAHEGLHAAGQVNMNGYHMGLFEVSLAVLAVVTYIVWRKKEGKVKK